MTEPREVLAELVEAAWAVRPYLVHTLGLPPSLARLDRALRAARDLGVGEHPAYADDVWTDQVTLIFESPDDATFANPRGAILYEEDHE
jgi:hypothetical protein